MDNDDILVNFLFEVGMLAHTPRSGFQPLGSGSQSVAEHTHRVVYIGYTLSAMTPGTDTSKVMKMCLFHDLPEGRTSDLNYIHQKYAQTNEKQALRDLTEKLPFGDDILQLHKEYEERESIESKLAKDADNLEWIMCMKEQADIGNKRAETFIPPAVKRLKTPAAQRLATRILLTNSDEWWYGDKQDQWWVSRNKQQPDNHPATNSSSLE